jgi:hypothetical protein
MRCVLIVSYDQVHEWMAQANLVILFGLLLFVVFSIFLVKRKRLVWHGNTMLVVVMVTGLLVIAHMGPSLIRVVGEGLQGFDVVALAGIVHSVFGFVAVVLGVWLVGVWAYVQSSETIYCARKKKLMWRILALWLLSLGLGALYYVLHISLG